MALYIATCFDSHGIIIIIIIRQFIKKHQFYKFLHYSEILQFSFKNVLGISVFCSACNFFFYSRVSSYRCAWINIFIKVKVVNLYE
jgi:hypothetical protein